MNKAKVITSRMLGKNNAIHGALGKLAKSWLDEGKKWVWHPWHLLFFLSCDLQYIQTI